ncbi:hypothetical protein LIER_21900 [Lithospermum erythrorhizon]|uniref:Glucose-methanol-choline oxidoreductase N-terminal domain-containing protein n=1 Tax=Lithospermum erythrorhizon TaxID=34254 RepID=A0AAV3QVB7_LITER
MMVYYNHLLLMIIRTMLLAILLVHCASEKAPNYTFMHQATSAPLISYYDYIIVGGGTAGCPLAVTLSENSNVLLLERGGSPYGNPNITNVEAFAAPLSDLSPSSLSQRFVSEDRVINARARVLGGGTCTNAGFYTRAEASFVKEAGWHGTFEPVMRQFRDGLLEVGVLPYTPSVSN